MMLLVNSQIPSIYDWNQNFIFFTGKYSDFVPEWFSDVGVVIVITLIKIDNLFIIKYFCTSFPYNI